ncbi:AraC family transcriptional activator of mtrCDE [Paraburkholderia sp. BL6665CI2N2]|uniref:AraC family transcriptional regulator n=1 Tax=Paraburkholderia sp. BL6665CI2N2 TaxID=1938806 RepID=UPI0010650F3F|nr:AraC family transcriptional regulator [Paraburkholderia sp. BL6665CI2N2]TDY26654.1 AraC family transcriptional activator of mtrCDE [Paraburkholderia sp. BL6665CI2N2]
MPVSQAISPPRLSPDNLNELITLLDIQVLGLSECVVSQGFMLELDGHDAPGIHYILSGEGRLHIAGAGTVPLTPHTLLIVPAGHSLKLEVPTKQAGIAPTVVPGREHKQVVDSISRFRAGNVEPMTVMICGYFRASFGASINLFGTLSTPIVEQFEASDRLDVYLRTAFDELVAQEIGAGAMSGALLKQVIVALVRRSLKSSALWMERFALLGDPQIARAFADMVARPGAPHTVASLAEAAILSRSAFMARFSAALGQSPMQVLRDIRMRQAAAQLRAGDLSLDQVARHAGYASRGAFARAFREVFDTGPAEYRDGAADG